MTKSKRPADDHPEHSDPDAVRMEILLHQRSFWRFFRSVRQSTQKMIIWGIFFLLLYLLRSFFPLLFLTFVLSFVGSTCAKGLGRWFPHVGWKPRVVVVFVTLLALLTGVVWVLVPQAKAGVSQLRRTVEGLPKKFNDEIEPWMYQEVGLYRAWIDSQTRAAKEERQVEAATSQPTTDEEVAATQPTSAPTEMEHLATRRKFWNVDTVQEWLTHAQSRAPQMTLTLITDVGTVVAAIFMLVFLSMLFSFLIVFDLANLKREVMKLEQTKLHDFYRETVLNIVKFGAVLGKVLEAQGIIALVNTVLTAIGLWLMDVPNIAFLCLGVFICGFIPVAGVFISSVPICLVGLYQDGIGKFFLLIGFITLIHMLEAYVLNPRIMGAALRINPVLALVILVIGHHSMGVWGLLLGLPLCYYFFTYVIKREEREFGFRLRSRRKDAEVPPVVG